MKKLLYLCIILLVLPQFSCKKDTVVALDGYVNFMSGKVNIILDGKKTGAEVGAVVKNGAKVETGAGAFVDIYFGDNAVRVLENSLVEIGSVVTNMKDNTEKSEYTVEKGKMFSRVTKKLAKGDEFTIKTPTTIAGVRGTEFLVSEENGKGMVACIDGKVAVSDATAADKKGVEINAGEEVSVEPGKDLVVKALSEENRANLAEIKQSFREAREDIREQFRKQKEEILKQVRDQKEENRKMVEEQKKLDQENIDRQKAEDMKNIEAIKGTADSEKKEAVDATEKQKEDAKKNLEGVKPEIKKPSLDFEKPSIY